MVGPVKRFFFIEAKNLKSYLYLVLSKVRCEGVKLYFFCRCIHNKKWGKVKN